VSRNEGGGQPGADHRRRRGRVAQGRCAGLMSLGSHGHPGFVKPRRSRRYGHQTPYRQIARLESQPTRLSWSMASAATATANLAVRAGPYQGGAVRTSTSFRDAVDHVEVLLEGQPLNTAPMRSPASSYHLEKDNSARAQTLRGGLMDAAATRRRSRAHVRVAPTRRQLSSTSRRDPEPRAQHARPASIRALSIRDALDLPNSNMPFRTGYPYLN